jgi:probable selenium-dependent hydroxylase accessory protein YqeC
MLPHYDLVLLEADGSSGLPCKGWLPDEPVVPSFCTHTIGVVTLSALGKPADSDTVQRLPEFLKLTGLRQGEPISRQALTAMVCAENGMFRRGHGRLGIFLNQAEDPAAAIAAEQWLGAIQRENPGRFAFLAYGSARANRWNRICMKAA